MNILYVPRQFRHCAKTIRGCNDMYHTICILGIAKLLNAYTFTQIGTMCFFIKQKKAKSLKKGKIFESLIINLLQNYIQNDLGDKK